MISWYNPIRLPHSISDLFSIQSFQYLKNNNIFSCNYLIGHYANLLIVKSKLTIQKKMEYSNKIMSVMVNNIIL